MDNKNNSEINIETNFEYTMVLDGNYQEAPEKKVTENKVVERLAPKPASQNETMDRLYYEYEKMCLKNPLILDKDDIYPHTYHWRQGSPYDPDKEEVLREAVRQGKMIVDTDAYQKYIETVKKRKFAPVSWD